MLIAALAYTYADATPATRASCSAPANWRPGGFSSAIILAMISLLIAYEAVTRFMAPVPIHFDEAIPIAMVGLVVNIVSAWLLSDDDHHDHAHGHAQDHHHGHHGHDHADGVDAVAFAEHEHDRSHAKDGRDLNMRAAMSM